MDDQTLLKRITTNSSVLTGKPIIKGTRLSVEFILNLLSHGATPSEILNEYKGIEVEDIHACLIFPG